MEQSQLFELILCLDPKEAAHVREFAKTTFFNPGPLRQTAILILEVCFEHALQGTQAPLEKKAVYARVFPGQPFKAGKLEKAMVEAHKVVRAFIGVKHYLRDKNEFHHSLDFAEAARRRGLEDRFGKTLSRLRKQQDESGQKDLKHYYRQYHLEFAEHYYASLNNKMRGDIHIPGLLHSVEAFYYIRLAALLNRYMLQQKVARLDAPDFVQNLILEYDVPERYLSESPPLKIYFEVFKIFKKESPSLDDIRSLFNLLRLHENIEEETLQELYAYLRNFVALASQASGDDIALDRVMHEIYLDNLARGYLLYEGKLSPTRFLAICENAINVREFDWARDFVENYKEKIYGDNPERDIYRFVKASYLFSVGRYDACVDHIPPSSQHIDFMLRGKRLELKALYELESDLFSYKLDAFKMFLSRNANKLLPDRLRQKNLHFVNLLMQIQHTSPGQKARAERLLQKLQNRKETVEWRWLLSKVQQLQRK